MNDRFAYYLAVVVSFFLLYTTGCANVKDFQPPPSDNLPDSVLQVFKNAVPDAQNAVFKAVVEGKLYEVNYERLVKKYYAVLNSKQILKNQEYLDALPDTVTAVLGKLFIAGGVLSEAKKVVSTPGPYTNYIAKYTLEGRDYTLTIDYADYMESIGVSLRPYYKFSYNFTGKMTLVPEPERLHAYIDRNNLRYDAELVTLLYFDSPNIQNYNIRLLDSTQLGHMFEFDGQGELLYTTYNAVIVGSEIGVVPEPIRNFITGSPAFSNYEYLQCHKLSRLDDSGYVVRVSRPTNSEVFTLSFDEKGNSTGIFYDAFPKY